VRNVNQRLRELRKSLGLSQESFGKILDISNTTVADLESGRRPITDKHLKRLAKYTDAKINIEWLRTGEGTMFLPMDKEEHVREFVDAILMKESSDFKKQLIVSLSELSEESWEALEEVLKSLKRLH
jgi:transcriptional regulator with XRE-family HTH domain